MTGTEDIKAMALAYGACDMVNGITSVKDAVKLLMTPQGREFAVKSGFPTLEVWRSASVTFPKDLTAANHVMIDMTLPSSIANRDIIAVGDTSLTAYYDKPDALHHVVAMHGAKVLINASNYAVVTVSSFDAEVMIEGDGTAIVYVEEAGKGVTE